ncbi:hypothetical protein MKW94_012679 [Papaver nudicaule]|uniref:Protein kinase domain-containing protein n=1 Tax=Papaver nudicaule TaxID=74823 RepID=A0AA42B3V0_PAPNU|nr:hypothetical protein [Papaver nudicaule]
MAWYPLCSLRPVGSSFVPVTGSRDNTDIENFVKNQGRGSNPREYPSDEGNDNSSQTRKLKFLCSFGGKFLPRPSDGILRYVGGQTRIISVARDISFHELVQKMHEDYGQPVVFKYQLPDQDLDALVSVSCPEDLDNMVEEYEKLVENSVDGSPKLRVFLFSASELDSSGTVKLGDSNDSAQKYFDAVNGISDLVGCGITRRGSMASVASTQNSDRMSGGDAVDSSSLGQGPPSPVVLSPRRSSGASSHDGQSRVVYVTPNHAMYTESQSANYVVPTISSSRPPAQWIEAELERPVHAMGQQPPLLGYDIGPPSGIEYTPTTVYMQGYSRREVFQDADYPPVTSQMGYLNPPQVSGITRSTYRRADNPMQTVRVQPHQFMPAMQMTHASMRPNGVQHLMQQHQTHVNSYPEETLYGGRVAQVLGEQNYRVLPSQAPSHQAAFQPQGGYDWHQPATPGSVVFSDGCSPRQQGNLPEQVLGLEDCHMCQKELPHAHSDTVVQDQRETTSMVSSSMPAFQSLRFEDTLRAQPANRVIVSVPQGEGIVAVEHPEAWPRPKYVGPTNHDIATQQLGVDGFPPNINLRVRNDSGSVLLQNPEAIDQHRVMLSPSVMPDNVHSPHGVYMAKFSQAHHEDVVLQPTVQYQYRDINDPSTGQLLYADAPPVRMVPFQTSEPVNREFLEHSNRNFGNALKDDIDDLRRIDVRLEALHIIPPETSANNENSKSPVNIFDKEGILDARPQFIAEDVPQTNAFVNTGNFPDENHVKPADTLPATEAVYLHSHQLEELNQVTQSSGLGVSGPFPHSTAPTENLASDQIWHGKPAFPQIDPAKYPNVKRMPLVGDWKDEASHIKSSMLSNDATAASSSGLVSEFCDPSTSDSLFSTKDPWILRHDTHFPPPKPSKVVSGRETCTTREGVLHQQPGNLNKDSASEHGNSSKGSAEEHIGQELRSVAEGVAASVLQSSLHSDRSDHEMKQPLPDGNLERELHVSCTEAEDIVKDETNSTNSTVPLSDGIGRLQIIKNSDLEELRELGSGTFGTVYHGKWRGTDVAIKRINDRCFDGKPSEQSRMRDDFWNEAINLADLHHPNVVAFYGVVLDGPGGFVATVTEYMVNGSLRQAFQRNDKVLDKRKRLFIAMDVAFGMEYLHGKNIVHFDLKSDNLLVNLRDPHRPICKVGDLGLSKVKCQTLISGGVRGTLPWMAPELLNGSSNLVSEKVDVFSYGIVMWELLTGEEPYADLHYGAIIGGIVSNTLRPAVPESCDTEWRSLMERCWSADPAERPSFKEIASQLRIIAASLPTKGQA